VNCQLSIIDDTQVKIGIAEHTLVCAGRGRTRSPHGNRRCTGTGVPPGGQGVTGKHTGVRNREGAGSSSMATPACSGAFTMAPLPARGARPRYTRIHSGLGRPRYD
jgi:hypothetical protein